MKAVSLMVVVAVLALTGCAPEVGSKKWCEQLEKKPKGDWTANEAKDYTKHCIFRDDN